MKYIISLLLIFAFAVTSLAQSKVYVTEHGKKYHLYSDCSSLKHSKPITIDLKDIKDRTICLICKHKHDKEK